MNLLTINVALFLTLIRLILSPLVLPLLFSLFLPLQSFLVNCFLGSVFILFSFTDFLDGFVARRYGQETEWGTILDPIADKFLLFSTIISLVYFHKIYFFWAIIFIGREFFIISLRQVASNYRFNLQVIQSAKIKTLFQLFYLFWVIINPYQHLSFWNFFNIIEFLLLIISLYLTLFSVIQYYFIFMKQIGELK